MKRTEAEWNQLEAEILLRYMLLRLRAESGALWYPRPEAPLLLVARTELWPHAGHEQVETIWRLSRRQLQAGQPVRRGPLVVQPLFGGHSPQLKALLALTGQPENGPTLGEQQMLLDLLVRQVMSAVAPPPNWEECLADVHAALPAGARNQIQEAMRERIEDALAHCRGNVTQTARRLGVPLRTLWNHIQRLGIEPARFRVRPA